MKQRICVVYESDKDSVQRYINNNFFDIYIHRTKDLNNFLEKNKGVKTYIQKKVETSEIYDNLISNIPLSWLDFILENEKIIIDISNVCRYIPKNELIPVPKYVFRFMSLIKPKDVKILIMGQDPYPNKAWANGLAFSCNIDVPPTLDNIFSKLKKEGFEIDDKNGNLERWVDQGVLLLNASCTVSLTTKDHYKLWKPFTTNLIKYLTSLNENLIAVLFGNKAKSYKKLFKNPIITSHPSPRSFGGENFFDKIIFKEVNDRLTASSQTPIDWK